MADTLAAIPSVALPGFVQPDDLPHVLGQPRCLVLPSTFEPWGVVIHEAVTAGLPVVCTKACGASTRLVLDGYNREVVRPGDAEHLAGAMARISKGQSLGPVGHERAQRRTGPPVHPRAVGQLPHRPQLGPSADRGARVAMMRQTPREQARSTALDKIDRLARFAEVAVTPGGLRALKRWRPASVAAFRLVQGLVAEDLSFATVIDVGANVGQFSRAVLGIWPKAEVIAFEPLTESARRFERALTPIGRVEMHVVALGASDGTTAFYPHEYTHSSSPLPVAEATAGRRDGDVQRLPIEVPIRRLDGVLAGRDLARPLLAKLDVQGFELEVLAGGQATLEHADALVIEQSFERVYQGQPLFGETHGFLEAAGWRLLRPLDWRRRGGRVVEADCLYLRGV